MTASVFRCFSSQASPICGTMPRRNKGSDEEEGLSNWKENWKEEGKWGEEGKGEWKEEGKWIWVVEEGKEEWKEDWKGKGECKEEEATVISDDDGADGAFPGSPGDGSQLDVPEPAGMPDDSDEDWGHCKDGSLTKIVHQYHHCLILQCLQCFSFRFTKVKFSN